MSWLGRFRCFKVLTPSDQEQSLFPFWLRPTETNFYLLNEFQEDVVVFHCYVTYYYKFSSLKHLLSHIFCESGIRVIDSLLRVSHG